MKILEVSEHDNKAKSDCATAEGPIWSSVGCDWRQLYGSFQRSGFSFEWHQLESGREVDWARSFHPGSVEICMNVSGEGYVRSRKEEANFQSATSGFYSRGNKPLEAKRLGKQNHQFLTVEFSAGYLAQHLSGLEQSLHPILRKVVEGKEVSGVSAASALSSAQQSIVSVLQNPPVPAAAHALWYQSKATELMAQHFFQTTAKPEFFCTRQKKLAKERVEQVITLLQKNLCEPPSLDEIGAGVGCSPFYLSRTFSSEMGMGIPQFLRQLRLEKAAELLKSGEYNVTEAAMEVGYSSLSHFSQAFHQRFGCCPGLYPLKTVGFGKV